MGRPLPDPVLSERFERALVMAVDLHRHQRRKGSPTPYSAHLLGVASLVLEAGGSEQEAIAALLHDAVEDQGGADTLELIRAEFGDDVAAIVEACTDTDQDPKPPWRERKEAYLASMAGKSESALRVTAADKLHNLRSTISDLRIGDPRFERFNGGRDGMRWYYGEIARWLERGPLAGSRLEREYAAVYAEFVVLSEAFPDA